MPRSRKKPEGSLLTVLVALGANVVIAIAKTLASVLTGSASMTAEAAHSWADSGNEVFLLIAERRSTALPDDAHPFGFGRDTYVWSLFAAFGVFMVGAVVSIQHGLAELTTGGPVEAPLVAYLVLAASFVLEGTSFLRSVQQTRKMAAEAEQEVLATVLTSSDPTVRAVFFEDAAALVGVVLAATGIALHQITGNAVWDALGSIAVGVVLGVVAILLIQLNRRFLVGAEPPQRVRSAVMSRLLDEPRIHTVSYLHLEYVGPARVFLVAAIDLVGDAPEHEAGSLLASLGRTVEEDEHVVRAVMTLSEPGAPVLDLDGRATATVTA